MRNAPRLRCLLCVLVIVYCSMKTGLMQADAANAGDANLTATLLIEAYNSDGRLLNFSDFFDYTYYFADSTKRWAIYGNYGVFPVGTPPATAQMGSTPFATTKDGIEYIAFAVPPKQPLYFTCLWKAPTIGTVFMRADNEGTGFLVPENQSQVLQLPYEFALSEYHTASQIFSDYSALGYKFSTATATALLLASTLVEGARSETNPAARAVASYGALAVIMPAKERLVVEVSNHSIAKTGYRSDFIFNYTGFGSWTDSSFVPYYELAKKAGFTFVLTTCDWNKISPTDGVYDFSYLDYEIDKAISLGFGVALNVMPSVEVLPQWAVLLSFDDLKTLYYENARLVVNRYKDKVALIYPMAEPELATHRYNIDQIVELTKQALNGARDAAPSKFFGIFLSASAYVGYQMTRQPESNFLSSWDFINYVARNNIQADFFGLQMQYATIFAPVDLQRIYEHLIDVYNVIKKPIYIAETTYSSKTEDYGIQSQFYWHDGLTQLAQAEWADGILKISYGNTFIKGMSWTHLDPDNYDYGSDFLSSLIGSSLIRSNGTPKAAYSTFKNFMDGITENIFSDVPSDYWAHDYIIAIYNEGITVGCAQDDPNTLENERRYCPEDNVTRGQMAAFIIRAKYGETFSYTTIPYFTDVSSTHTFFKYVQKLRDDAITVVSGTYGVDNEVTRGQMAAFIIRAKFGENFSYTTTPYFSDVPSTHNFFKYVQKLKDEGITAVTGTYGVDNIVTRAQMAAFLARAFLGME